MASIEITTTPYPSRAQWLTARKQSLGASDSPKVLGLTSYGGQMAVYADKLHLLSDDATNLEAAEWGLLLEPLVAARYQRETGYALEDPGDFTIVRNAAYPFLHASPDRFVVHPTRGRGLLSIKTTSAYKKEEWSEEVPPAYQVQAQHEMLVCDLPWTAVAVLIGGNTFRYLDCIERDDRFCARLVTELRDFWTRIEQQDPPGPDGSEACRDVLKRLYPKESGEAIALDAALLDMDEMWLEAKKQLDYWAARKDLAENTLRAALQAAPKGVLPNGVGWTLKSQTRKEFISPEVTFRVLRRTKKG